MVPHDRHLGHLGFKVDEVSGESQTASLLDTGDLHLAEVECRSSGHGQEVVGVQLIKQLGAVLVVGGWRTGGGTSEKGREMSPLPLARHARPLLMRRLFARLDRLDLDRDLR